VAATFPEGEDWLVREAKIRVPLPPASAILLDAGSAKTARKIMIVKELSSQNLENKYFPSPRFWLF
jgi:hypothetical protein